MFIFYVMCIFEYNLCFKNKQKTYLYKLIACCLVLKVPLIELSIVLLITRFNILNV